MRTARQNRLASAADLECERGAVPEWGAQQECIFLVRCACSGGPLPGGRIYCAWTRGGCWAPAVGLVPCPGWEGQASSAMSPGGAGSPPGAGSWRVTVCLSSCLAQKRLGAGGGSLQAWRAGLAAPSHGPVHSSCSRAQMPDLN